MKNKRKIYIGWDSREIDAYDVAKDSILRNCKNSNLLEINALKLSELNHIINRPIEWRGTQMWCKISDAPQSTEFAASRFVLPFITEGWVLFVDCDIVCIGDINELFDYANDKYAIMVVKHKQIVKEDEIKMVDQISTYYNRKNWSSIMLINCNHPSNKKLTINALNNWPGRDLHAFKWLNDDEIGELPLEWNYLVDVSDYDKCEEAKLLHYTLGGPWLNGWKEKKSDYVWNNAYNKLKN